MSRTSKPDRGAGPRRLRREVAGTVGLVADERAFAAIRRYRSFGFADHAAYLRQLEGLLRELAAQGLHTRVALFDPAAFADFCARRGLDPDTAASRTLYTAEEAGRGGCVPYRGQRVGELIPQLRDEAVRRHGWERSMRLLAQAGRCADCGEDLGRAAFDAAGERLRALLAALGPGRHHLVCTVHAEEGEPPLAAVLHVDTGPDVPPHPDGAERDMLRLCGVLAAGIAGELPGGVVLRTSGPPGERETVRGWRLRDGGLEPLTEAEVFNAYCTDAVTGEPVPPEPGVDYRAGFPLPPPGEGASHG